MIDADRELLILFDLDGTLLTPRSGAGAERAFWRGLAAALDLPDLEPIWLPDLEHVSCNAVANRVCELHRGRRMTGEEAVALRRAYLEALRSGPGRAPVAARGAKGLLARLDAGGIEWAVATGCFEETARFKLARAGLPADAVLAGSDGCEARAGILRTAVARAEARSGRRFARILAVGDGSWDLRAARELGLGFVGIASGERAGALRAAGAADVLPHFHLAGSFLALARSVALPR